MNNDIRYWSTFLNESNDDFTESDMIQIRNGLNSLQRWTENSNDPDVNAQHEQSTRLLGMFERIEKALEGKLKSEEDSISPIDSDLDF